MRSRNGQCDPELQRAADLFNPQLVQTLMELNDEIGSDVFVSANAFRTHMNYIYNPEVYGKGKLARCMVIGEHEQMGPARLISLFMKFVYMRRFYDVENCVLWAGAI